MDMPEQLNVGIAHIELNLLREPPIEEAACLTCTLKDGFLRFFSYMTGMTLAEYVRRRRLTLAADALRETDEKVIDLALRFGYDSADAFSRAFHRQHGVSPAEYRKNGGAIRIYPPASFHILIKGAKEMDFRIMELEERKVMGLAKPYDTAKYRTREALRHEMWADSLDDVPGKITTGRWAISPLRFCTCLPTTTSRGKTGITRSGFR